MDWNEWYKQYDSFPSLQARLRIVCEQIAATLDDCPAGSIRIVSICAGDGRDLIGALLNHSRRNDVVAWLLDNHAESITRGRAAAEQAGLGRQLRFLEADATLAGNYVGAVPADLVLLSGFLGHLRHKDVPRLIESLPMLCRTGGWTIWSRHLVMHKGREQVPAIRELFRRARFEEVHFETTAPDGFAVGRSRFAGRVKPLDPAQVLFEFVGLDRLLPVPPPTHLGLAKGKNDFPGETCETVTDENLGNVDLSLPEYFAQIAARHPSRPAIGAGGWRPAYTELNASANRLAHTLLGGGGASGGRVALLMRHDAPLIAAILAVLKAGGIVVVLNPTDPPTRLKQILADASPGAIITDSANCELAAQIIEKNQRIVCFEEHLTGPAHDPEIKVAPEAVAFLIFTSGSTGRPKGVMQTHCNIIHNVLRLSRGMRLQPEDRISLLASPSGGQGLSTMWCALLNGAALCPFPAMEKGVTGLADWMKENKITVFVSTVSLFRHFIRTLKNGDCFPAVRLVRFGSEPAISDDFAAYKKHFTAGCVLLNTLSSTETGNVTQLRFTQNDRVAPGRLPTGWPAAGMEILLLDGNGREVRAGEVGEIAVSSRYLSPGYWRNESLTAACFSEGRGPDGVRVFHSGDLGRRMADGLLMFMGRRDARVKVHGYRIEVSEIEDALVHQPEVEGAVVGTCEAPNHDTQLVAYVVLRTGRKCTAETLRRILRSTLPGHMVPASFIFLEEFPLTPHGKIDRLALRPPPENRPPPSRRSRPRDIVESQLARIWQSVLEIPRIGRHDDFFDLGGTSIQSAEVLARIEELYGASLSPSTLVEHSTIERLAGLVAGYVVIPSPSPLVTLRTADAGRPLFLVHSGQGDVTSYGLLVRRLPGRPIYGLQSVGLQGESWPLMGIHAMAQRYLREIVAKDPTGPYLLGATCMGGMVAFEMAQMLVRQGRKVGLLALFDVPCPLPIWQHHDWIERLYGPIRDPVRDAFRMLRWAIIRAAGLGRNPRVAIAYRRFVSHMNGRANRHYRPDFFPGAITLFNTVESKFPREDRRLVMRRYAKETQVILLPGNRSGLFARPVVDELARQLQSALALAEGKGPP
ncbi:MAG: AMP-binding protein [Verrucomicrobiota bacterium]|jgi:amino acid adenylation domain-containing protein